MKFPDDSSEKAMFYNNYRTKSLAKMEKVADREKAEDSQEDRGGPMKIKTEKNVPRAERDGKTDTKAERQSQKQSLREAKLKETEIEIKTERDAPRGIESCSWIEGPATEAGRDAQVPRSQPDQQTGATTEHPHFLWLSYLV